MDIFGIIFDLIRCPVCFAKEMDSILYFDADEDEYYCKKCCFTGSKEEINRIFDSYRQGKYKFLNKEHPHATFERRLKNQ